MPEASPIRVLIVDDDPAALELLDTHLTRAGYEVLRAANGVDAMKILVGQGPQLVVTDWGMPQMGGIELCRQIRKHEGIPIAYVIIVTAHSDENCIVEAVESGADDYLSKPFDYKELLARVRSGVRVVQLQNDVDRRHRQVHRINAEMAVAQRKLQDANQQLQRMATTDMLTGLGNRRAAMERLKELWMSATRNESPIACIMMDIDKFKSVNDTYGHATGDLVLIETAKALRGATRAEEPVYRIGGEEFLVICPQAAEETAAVAAERLRNAVADDMISADGTVLQATISAGVSERTPDMRGYDDLLGAADRALYEAKRTGRNRVCRVSKCEAEATAQEVPVKRASVSMPFSVGAGEAGDSPEVLVVADDTEQRTAIKELLESESCTVFEVVAGKDVLARADQHCPDIIVVSLLLPDMAGVDCVRRLRAHTNARDLYVIMVVPELTAVEVSCLLAQGVDDCISASSLSMELVPRVRTAARLRRHSSELARAGEIHEEQSRAMGVLLELSSKLASARSLDDVLRETLSATAGLACNRRVSIMLPDDRRERLAVAKSIGIEEGVACGYSVPIGSGIVGKVFASGDSAVISSLDDISSDDQSQLDLLGSAPLVCKALRTPDSVIGVLNISERENGLPFQPHTLEWIDLLCNLAAGAVRNWLARPAHDNPGVCDPHEDRFPVSTDVCSGAKGHVASSQSGT